MRRTAKSVAVSLLACVGAAQASTPERLAPYPIDPLSVYVRTSYPADVNTVGEAARYVLEPTGYRLVITRVASPTASRMAAESIPPIAKLNRTMPVIDALQLLIGLNHWVIVDPTHKLVTFQENAP